MTLPETGPARREAIAFGIAAIGALAFLSGVIRRTETGPPAPIVPRMGGVYVPRLAEAPPVRIDVSALRSRVPVGGTLSLRLPDGPELTLKGTGGDGAIERLRRPLADGPGPPVRFVYVLTRPGRETVRGEGTVWTR